jgi:RNA polymerase sigma-B factor
MTTDMSSTVTALAQASVTAVRGTFSEELPWIEDASKVAPKDARSMSRMFFDRLQILEEGTHEYQYARNTPSSR